MKLNDSHCAIACEYRRNRVAGYRASDALKRAKKTAAESPEKAGRWSRQIWRRNPANPVFDYLRRRGAWYEAETLAGLREAWSQDADGFGRRMPKGYYLNDFGETVHGVVYQLPGRNGESRYLAGYSDPWNLSAAWVSVEIFRSTAGDESGFRDACLEADQIAERFAEESRRHDEEYRAGYDAAEKAREAREACEEWLALARKIKTIFQERHDARRDGIPLAMTRDWITSQAESVRELRDAFCEAREKFHESLPRKGFRKAGDAWKAGYSDGL